MDLAVLTILMTRPNHWDMLSLIKECVINGDTVAQSICCLHKLVLSVNQLLPQVGSHHGHVHPYLIQQEPLIPHHHLHGGSLSNHTTPQLLNQIVAPLGSMPPHEKCWKINFSGWVGAGLMEINANSALKLSLT